jgi:putative Mg2+ transporter-C (MgtC) family protein
MLAHWELVLRLVIAAGLGSLIGAERERLIWAAGLRTHMLVCVGACLFMVVSAYGFASVIGPGIVLDPSRVAAQVVSGIGFLGAGSILLRGDLVRGLTTAASLWTVAAIGLAVGGGLYVEAVAATLIILIILAGIKPLEKRYLGARQRRELLLTADRGALTLDTLNDAMGAGGARVKRFIVQQHEDDNGPDEIIVTLSRVTPREFAAISTRLHDIPGLHDIKEVEPS